MTLADWPYIFRCFAKVWFSLAHKYKHKHIRTRRMAYLTQFSIPLSFPQLGDKQDCGRFVHHIAFDTRMRSGSKWPMMGPLPCAYAIAYVDPVFASQSSEISINMSTRRTNLSVFLVLMLMLMPTQFSLAYTWDCACACAYAYALAKTRLNQHEGVEFGVGVLSMVSFTRRLRSKWVPFSGFRYIKGYELSRFTVYGSVKKICHRPTLYVIPNYGSFILFQSHLFYSKGLEKERSHCVLGMWKGYYF